MATFHVDGSNDMSALDLSTIANGTITTNTSSKVVIQATDGTTYVLTGDFSGGTGTTMPTGGTITGWTSYTSNTDSPSHIIISGLGLPVSDFNDDVQHNNATALQDEMFSGNDTFNLTGGNGQNNVIGAGGNDLFELGSTLAATDSIDGCGGFNTVTLDGDYAGLTLAAGTLLNMDRIDLLGAHSYNITTNDAMVVSGQTFDVDARNVGSDGSLTFNGSAETDGKFDFFLGSTSNLNVTGGAGNDIFNGGGSGATLNGGGGDDTFNFGGNFDGTDAINGGSGFNTLSLDGDYSAGVAMGATALVNIDKIVLTHGNDYHLALNAANDGAGDKLNLNASDLHAADSVTFDASAVAGNLYLQGGAGADTLIGGTGFNVFYGGGGADRITANTGTDHFFYGAASDSTGTHYDAISGFDADHDKFVLANAAVNAIDTAVATGALSTATFNGDLSHAIGAAQLGAHDAVLFTADSGTLSGDTFLIIDENGVAGYQGKGDLVIQLTGAHNLGDLSTSNFGDHTTLV